MATRINRVMDPLFMSDEQRREYQARGIQSHGIAGYAPARFYNPRRIAGTVPEAAGNLGGMGLSDYQRLTQGQDVNRMDDFYGKFEQSIPSGGREVARPLESSFAAGPGRPAETGLMPAGAERFRRREIASNLRSQGAAGVVFNPVTEGGFGGGSVVKQLLEGPEIGGGRPPSLDSGALEGRPAAGGAPSGWGGTMRPLTIPKGTSLLEMRQMYGGIEGDPVLAARRAEYDRNLAEYLRQVPAWQSREEFERGLATLPGAGQEILGHIQRRAVENMPAPFVREWEEKEATRAATGKALVEAATREATYQDWKSKAPPEQKAVFYENYEQTPDGWKRKPPPHVTVEEKRVLDRARIEKEALEAWKTMKPDEEMYDLNEGRVGALPKPAIKKKGFGRDANDMPLTPYIPPGVLPGTTPVMPGAQPRATGTPAAPVNLPAPQEEKGGISPGTAVAPTVIPPVATGIETPPRPGANKAPDGKWYIPDPNRPGKYLQVT